MAKFQVGDWVRRQKQHAVPQSKYACFRGEPVQVRRVYSGYLYFDDDLDMYGEYCEPCDPDTPHTDADLAMVLQLADLLREDCSLDDGRCDYECRSVSDWLRESVKGELLSRGVK